MDHPTTTFQIYNKINCLYEKVTDKLIGVFNKNLKCAVA